MSKSNQMYSYLEKQYTYIDTRTSLFSFSYASKTIYLLLN